MTAVKIRANFGLQEVEHGRSKRGHRFKGIFTDIINGNCNYFIRHFKRRLQMKGWIGFDLDGTVAHYDKWRGKEHIGKPIKSMIKLVKKYLNRGYHVKIFTARAYDPEAIPFVVEWCKKHIGQALEVTNEKDFGCIKIFDDRSVRIIPNAGTPCCQHDKADFNPPSLYITGDEMVDV
jgi:hypothetical protein